MRAFIALELPADFADDVAAMARRLSASLDGRFLDRSTYHLTLAFLGDIDDAEASRAMDALDAACAGSASVLLASDSLGKFGRPADATLWLGIASDPALATLAERVREELAARDVPFDPKPFRPHITLGRRVRIPKKPLPLLAFPPARAGPNRHAVQEHPLPRRRRVQASLHGGASGAQPLNPREAGTAKPHNL